jgi:hypothetical protein
VAETDEQPQQPESREHEPLAREGEHIAPAFERAADHCPYCGVLAPQQWDEMLRPMRGLPGLDESQHAFAHAWIVRCRNCRQDQYWVEFEEGIRIVKPLGGRTAPACGHARRRAGRL